MLVQYKPYVGTVHERIINKGDFTRVGVEQERCSWDPSNNHTCEVSDAAGEYLTTKEEGFVAVKEQASEEEEGEPPHRMTPQEASRASETPEGYSGTSAIGAGAASRATPSRTVRRGRTT